MTRRPMLLTTASQQKWRRCRANYISSQVVVRMCNECVCLQNTLNEATYQLKVWQQTLARYRAKDSEEDFCGIWTGCVEAFRVSYELREKILRHLTEQHAGNGWFDFVERSRGTAA